MSLSGRLEARLQIDNITAVSLGSVSDPISMAFQQAWADGSGAGQVSKAYRGRRTLAASASESLDLAGGLTDNLGAAITFTKVRLIWITAAAANVNNVQMGGAASNAFVTWVADATDVLNIRPGGFHILGAPDATGYTVTAGTGDLLKIANSGAGSSVTYDIAILGS